jgi:lipopolysaccharide export system permease protein
MNIGRDQLSRGKLSFALGFWWIHIPTVLIAIYLLWRSQQLPKPKPAKAMAAEATA